MYNKLHKQKISEKRNAQSGFTLIEVLVALSIFTVAVTGVITVASRGGLTAATVKNQTTATYLADEGLELMRALRDTTILSPGANEDSNWGTYFASGSGSVVGPCLSPNACDINILGSDGSLSTEPFPAGTDVISCNAYPGKNCPLYYDNRLIGGTPVAPSYAYYIDNNGLSTGSILPASIFTRKIVLTPITVSGGPTSYPLEFNVVVTVTWMQGTTTKTTSETENLYDWYQ